jgi:hypothetical protein
VEEVFVHSGVLVSAEVLADDAIAAGRQNEKLCDCHFPVGLEATHQLSNHFFSMLRVLPLLLLGSLLGLEKIISFLIFSNRCYLVVAIKLRQKSSGELLSRSRKDFYLRSNLLFKRRKCGFLDLRFYHYLKPM